MKRFILSVLSTVSFAAHAASPTVLPKNEPNISHSFAISHILNVQTFEVGPGMSVQLPKVKMADGTICQSYVSQVTKTHRSAKQQELFVIRVVKNRVCDKAAVVPAGFFGEEMVPKNLMAMKIVTANGLSYQVPVLSKSP